MKISELFLDEQKLTQGTRLPVGVPGGDDEWLDVLYMHSDEAERRFAQAIRADLLAGKLKNSGTDPQSQHLLLRQYSFVLIANWSFEDECTLENARELVRLSPDIRTRLISFSEDKSLFFPDAEKNSSSGAKKKSGSTKRTKNKP